MYAAGPQTPSMYWIAAATAAAAALYCLHRTLSSLQRDRRVADTPLVKIRSAAQGYVNVFGRAAAGPDGMLAAPLSGRPCIWWRYEIEQKVRGAKGRTNWETVDSGASVSLFALDDADAECLVGPVRAEITPTTKNVWYGENSKPTGFPAGSFGVSVGGDYRYTECLLGAGDRLSVLGEFHAHSETGDSGAAAAGLLKAWKADQAALLKRFDRNHDGHIDAEEWEIARQEAQRESQAQTLSAPVTRMCVISEPTHGEPFLIAALDAAHLVRRERLHAAMFFSLGLLSVAACAWALEHARDAHTVLTQVNDVRTPPSLPPGLVALLPAAVALARWVARRQQN
jgi:hypothetical protein